MPDVSPRMVLAGRTLTALFDGTVVPLIAGVVQIHLAVIRIGMSVAPVSRRIYTVEKVHASVDPLKDVCRGPDTHQIDRFILRQMRYRHIQDVIHLLMRLTDRQSPECVSRQIQLSDLFRILDADVLDALRPD